MQLTLISAPAENVVTLAEAKAHLRIDHTEEDTLVGSLIATANTLLEGRDGYLRRSVITQTWRMDRPAFPACRWVELPLPRLASVTHVKYYDNDNVLQTLETDRYEVVASTLVGRIDLAYNAVWPSTYERQDAVQITYVAGYGDATSVPAPIKQAALLMIGDMYAGRGDHVHESPESTIWRLLRPYRVVTV